MFHFALGKLGAAIRAGTGSAGVVPLFSRDYEATGSLGADATFTRASTATYVDSNGVIQTAAINTPRFDYSTGSRALLMEPAATNQCFYSSDIDNVAWVKTSCTVSAAAITSPDGTASAWSLLASSTSAEEKRLTFTVNRSTPLATRPERMSIYCKAGSVSWAAIVMIGSGTSDGTRRYINLTDGSVGAANEDFNGPVNPIDPIVENAGGGWWRITVGFDVDINDAGTLLRIQPANGNAGKSYSAANTVDPQIYVWGAQLEIGTTPTSYIPTSGSEVTRAADSLSYSGIAADNETRAITDAGTVDVDDWDGVVDATITGADNIAQISSITVYTTGERPA